ncbi:MAG: hypothetical protein ABJ275_08005 [Maricaulaceae bacterium]
MINEDVRHIIEPELAEGEELLWADKPANGFDMSILVGFAIVVVLFFFLRDSIFPDIFKGWRNPNVGVFVATAFIFFGVMWSIRACVLPRYESYFLTNHRIVIDRNVFPRQRALIPIEALDRVKATRKGRYGQISLLRAQGGMYRASKFQGSMGLRIPFITFEGFLMRGVSEPEKFIDLLNQLYPQHSY